MRRGLVPAEVSETDAFEQFRISTVVRVLSTFVPVEYCAAKPVGAFRPAWVV